MNLIPLPRTIAAQDGIFLTDHTTTIELDMAQDDHGLETARLLQQEIKKVIAITLPIKKVLQSAGNLDENCICFQYDTMDSKKEAYRLTVRPHKITITACSNRGYLYGAATLIQLFKIFRGEIGCLDIDDEPSFANRGYMLDVSRGRVPTMESLKALVDRLALYKINQLQLYMENCLRLDGLEEIWSQTDPLTPEDILELDCYCNIRGIELVPCIATFGHLYDLLRSETFGRYREMDTGPGETFTWYNRMRYHIINVSDPESFTLIKSILNQYMPLFRSNKINICCDETYDLGKGKSASLAQQMDYGEMYLFYVNQLVEYLQSKGKEVMIWGDILKSHPEHLGQLNAQVTCLNWYYDYGAKAQNIKIFSDNGFKQYVCPSVSGYSRLINDYDLSFTNIRELAKLGNQYHALGFLNTDWGDCGHINMPSLAIPGMIYGAAQGWNVEDDRDIRTIDQAISWVEFGDPGKNLVGLLRELSHQDIIIFNDLAFFRDYKVYDQTYTDFGISLYEKTQEKIMQVSENQLKTAVTRCAEVLNDLKQNNMGSYADRQDEMLEYYLAARGVALMQKLALVLKEHEYGQDVHPLDTPYELAGKLEYWLVDYCNVWRTGSRESELHRIKEFFGQICFILRKYEKKFGN
ncbi:beta-N-acetylhexosaminidase [Desulfitobacterium sp.]|uniref:beta-N-acetylhexosaminidase n=1 Tax=Desulfitobacterium sp. TaxID=49981 RepID=UPI002C05F10E|nr:family 20 glycosylhydrolase [Desulfitobacterium sp.]HVJ48726.1 family 20 glycosylhydrolase [Desulfitobacterium sp.]